MPNSNVIYFILLGFFVNILLMQGKSLDMEIMGCMACPETVIRASWLPVSYFGSLARSNSWVVSINPSDREFVGSDGECLQGEKQRFALIADFEDSGNREEVALRHFPVAQSYQDEYFQRNPYKPYFNRLGRFLLGLHNTRPALHDPLLPFKEGAFTSRQKTYVYAHLDTVKCATQRPWGRLDVGERAILQENCKPFFVQQLQQAVGLELLVVNGRSAMEAVFPLISAHFQYEGQRHRTPLGGKTAELEHGTVRVAGREVPVVGWSPNVVNQQLTTAEVSDLVDGIVSTCPWLR